MCGEPSHIWTLRGPWFPRWQSRCFRAHARSRPASENLTKICCSDRILESPYRSESPTRPQSDVDVQGNPTDCPDVGSIHSLARRNGSDGPDNSGSQFM